MFDGWRERRAQRRAIADAQASAARLAAWEHTDAQLAVVIEQARAVADGKWPAVDGALALRKGEHPLFELDSAGLVEVRRGPGHWQGGNQGISVHVPGTRSMRYRIGATRGTYQQGDEAPTVIDSGSFTVTDNRAVFVGAKQTREWAWEKLIGFHDDDVATWTGIAVSNRQKTSGVSYPREQAMSVRITLELGAAIANGTLDELVAELEDERAKWAEQRPAVVDPHQLQSGP